MTIGSMRNIDVIVGANLMAGNVNPPTRGYPGGYPSSLEGIVAGPGVEIDVGVQLREEVAIYERLKGVVFCSRPSSFACEAAGYVIAEWLPSPWVYLASGIGFEMLAPPGSSNGPVAPSGPLRCRLDPPPCAL
jgi:hypothetical protein